MDSRLIVSRDRSISASNEIRQPAAELIDISEALVCHTREPGSPFGIA